MDYKERSERALEFINEGIPDGDHHKAWIIDQIVRILTGCEDGNESDEYVKFLADYARGEDGPHTYSWNLGIAP